MLEIDRTSSHPRIHAHNTDVIGILETLREERIKLPGARAVVIGAGGAARAVAYALASEGARLIYIDNPRSPDRAAKLAREFKKRFTKTEFTAELPQAAETPPLISSFSARRSGIQSGASPPVLLVDEYAPVRKGRAAFDLIYRPLETAFLKAARARGLRTVGGLGMLISQALATWKSGWDLFRKNRRFSRRSKSTSSSS